MEKIVFTREDLYNLVWSEPLSRLAKKYNISDNGIRKRCKKMNIPLPAIGYWSKLKYGHKVKKPILPEKYDGDSKTVLCYRNEEGNYVEHVDSPFKILKAEIENNPKLQLIVPDRIARSEDLVVKARKSLSTKNSRSYKFVGMYETESDELRIMVSKSNIDRSLRFMNTFIKLLRARNHSIVVKQRKTYAVVFGEEIPILLREKAKIVNAIDKYGYSNREYHPNGILAFVFDTWSYRKKEWADSKKNPIESKLADILAYFELYAKKEIEDRIESEKRRKIQEEEERLLKELMRKKQKELSKIKELINNANYWKQAQILREYIQALENDRTLDLKRIEWLPWAKQKIEWFDPFSQGPDEILDANDRDKLIEELNEPKRQTHSYPFYSY